jgi:hypothetical protein
MSENSLRRRGMKNKVKAVIAVVGLCLTLLPLVGCNQKASDFNMEEVIKDLKENREIPTGEVGVEAAYEMYGRNLKKDYDSDEMTVYFKGKTAEITKKDLEMSIDNLVLSGLKEENAIKEAIKLSMEREALYEEAVTEGFNVTDGEIKDYFEELKGMMDKADNKAQVEAIIKGFGSEEKYWDFEFSIYKKDLPIIKYQKALETQYNDKDIKLRLDTVKPTYKEGFGGFLEQYKEALVKDQNFRLVK